MTDPVDTAAARELADQHWRIVARWDSTPRAAATERFLRAMADGIDYLRAMWQQDATGLRANVNRYRAAWQSARERAWHRHLAVIAHQISLNLHLESYSERKELQDKLDKVRKLLDDLRPPASPTPCEDADEGFCHYDAKRSLAMDIQKIIDDEEVDGVE